MIHSDKRILVTGAAGYIGRQVCAALAAENWVIGTDIRPAELPCELVQMDVRDPQLEALLRAQRITHVVHLAAVLGDSGDPQRDYDIDVNGSTNVVDACIAAGVRHLTVTSSGAAYGYHADNPPWISETDPLRGNDSYPYSRHKRLVEEMLAERRQQHPELAQLILRPGTVLGAGTRNLITNLFEKKVMLALRGAASPFVFIWDQDVVRIIVRGVESGATGAYNLAGDGALPLRELAHLLGKPCLVLPPTLVRLLLHIGQRLGLTRYGPAQLDFLRYRPVLDNQRLKTIFGYTPQLTSAQVFRLWRDHHREQ